MLWMGKVHKKEKENKKGYNSMWEEGSRGESQGHCEQEPRIEFYIDLLVKKYVD